MRKQQKVCTGDNWKPPASNSGLPSDQRKAMFLEIVDCEPHEIIDCGRWQNVIPDAYGGAANQTVYFGKHKGKRFCELPDDYLRWIAIKADFRGSRKAKEFARKEIERRKQTSPKDSATEGTDARL